MRLFLGVDGGQSATKALIGDESGRVLGEGRAGPCNHASQSEGLRRFLSSVGESVRSAMLQAGLRDAAFESACFGFSGGPDDKDELTRGLVKAEHYLITHDAWTGLAGALAGDPGVIVIAGTGSIAFGRNSAGGTARAGGWGYVFGDEGGAFDLVRQAVRAILRHEEGWGTPTALTALLLDATQCGGANELLHRFYADEYSRDKVAALAPLIDEAAASGDTAAQELLHSAAQSLAAFLASVRARLFDSSETVLASHAGGVFESSMLLERFRMLAELDGRTKLFQPQYQPAYGALFEAYRIAGVDSHIYGKPREKGVQS